MDGPVSGLPTLPIPPPRPRPRPLPATVVPKVEEDEEEEAEEDEALIELPTTELFTAVEEDAVVVVEILF